MSGPAAPKRADVVRNERRIVDAATLVLGRDPRATMAEVADEAELTRATVYRHYRSRQELIDAIRASCEAEIADLVADLPSRGAVLPALADLMAAGIQLGIRYRYLVLIPGELATSADIVEAQATAARLIARGQRRGEIDPLFDPVLVTHLIMGIATAACVPVLLGQVEHADAVAQARASLLKTLAV